MQLLNKFRKLFEPHAQQRFTNEVLVGSSIFFEGKRARVLWNIILLISLVAYFKDVILFQNDDTFIVPEIAWFAGFNSDFLQHLLILNQSRYTWVGDFQLFRPGVFLIYFTHLWAFF